MYFSKINTIKHQIPKKFSTTVRDHDISLKLREEGKSSEELENAIRLISLKELIALKLDLSFKSTGQIIFNLPLWVMAEDIIKDAILTYAISASRNLTEAAALLGITKVGLWKAMNKYQPINYFENKQENLEE